MTPIAYLDAVRKRCDAATPEPWIAAAPSSFGVDLICCESGDGFVIGDDAPATESDAEFIAHARADLPKLERIARLALDYREARVALESLFVKDDGSSDAESNRLCDVLIAARAALFAALEKLT